ncbi:uroporphyrinogen decarboxylase family protein [Thermoanaerobacter wiegelii]|nr:uroporphyrinogen decarboxylase family protein [Thermoanaerobacter wiegelii]
MGFPGIQLTNTTIKQNLEDAQTQFKTIKALKEKFNPDAVLYMMDLSVEAEALGLKINKPENESYTVSEHPITNIEELRKLKIPNPLKDGRMPLFVEVTKKMAKEFPDVPKIAYVIGPYTLVGLMTGAENTVINSMMEVEFVHEELNFAVEVIKRYGDALIEAGADALCILEPTATVLSPAMFEEFSGNYVKQLKKYWNYPTILHICGNTTHLIPSMVKTGCDGLSLDSDVSLRDVKFQIPDGVLIIGNLNPVSTVAYGKREQVEKEIRRLIEDMKDKKHFVLSSGCDIPGDADLENIQLMFDVARGRI